MNKLTTRYDYIVQQRNDGIYTRLIHLQNLSEITFFTAKGQGSLQGTIDHMDSMTDELCDFWLDEWRQEEAKKVAKEAAKLERQRLQALAQKEREDKLRKKEENKRKQLEALQRKQEAQSH